MKLIGQTEAMELLKDRQGKSPVIYLRGDWYDVREDSTIRKNRIVRKFLSDLVYSPTN